MPAQLLTLHPSPLRWRPASENRVEHFVGRRKRPHAHHPASRLGSNPLPGNCLRRGFSLVEVIMALGIVSFALMSLVALLPMGLGMVRDSATETALTSIEQTIRGELTQAKFSEIANMAGQTYFFDEAGLRLSGTAPVSERCFQVAGSGTTNSLSANLPSAADGFERSACMVNFTISFLTAASYGPESFTVLVARQSSQ